MASSLAELYQRLEEDDWRLGEGFSAEVREANANLYEGGVSTRLDVISKWLQNYQPCLFGKIAAKLGLLSYCILDETDIQGKDEDIVSKIQKARTQWTREGYEGKKSGFIIAVISRRISTARPNEAMKEFARKLCSMYLLDDILTDRVYLDDIYLEKPGNARATWKWNAGINYFSAQGDKRWWQDHRMPGGMAFSINSVGHMIKSGIIAKHMTELEHLLSAPSEGLISSRIDSSNQALQYAMLTIDNASEAVSGKATELLTVSTDRTELPLSECPIKLPKILEGKNFCEYEGYYDTDVTLPSEYFLPDVTRHPSIGKHRLDFTYLFDKHPENPDRIRLSEGQQVRSVVGHVEEVVQKLSDKERKEDKVVAILVEKAHEKRLMSALEQN